MEDVIVSEERQTLWRQAGSRLAYEPWAYTRGGCHCCLLGSQAKQTKTLESAVVPGNKAEGGRFASGGRAGRGTHIAALTVCLRCPRLALTVSFWKAKGYDITKGRISLRGFFLLIREA